MTAIPFVEKAWPIVTGCSKGQSIGCENCYARTMAKRFGHDVWGADKLRRFLSESHWRKPLAWNRKAEREGRRIRVFPSMRWT